MKISLMLFFTLLCSACEDVKDYARARTAVKEYMKERHTDYESIEFGQLFEQESPEDIQNTLQTKAPVRYSMVHSYMLGKRRVVDEYFHFDKDFNVIGHLSNDVMLKMVLADIEKAGLIDSLPSQDPAPIEEIITISVTDSSLIRSVAIKILSALKKKDFVCFAEFIHPVSGLLFSPNAYIDSTCQQKFSQMEFLDAAGKNARRKYFWGYEDGSGDSILLPLKEYIAEYVYDVDFLNAEQFNLNETHGGGNSLDNRPEIYKGLYYTEHYFSGFEPKYEGMDWRSLKLIFKKHKDKFFLVGLIHGEWTI